MMELVAHPAADVFPPMPADRYAELRDDIRAHGLRQPIALCDGRIIDGRHRYRACVELGIEPQTVEYAGNPWAYVWSLNGARRDLTDMQRALIHNSCQTNAATHEAERQRIAAEAKARRAEAANARRQPDGTLGAKAEPVVPPKVAALVGDAHKSAAAKAKAAGVGRKAVEQAQMLLRADSALADKVMRGDMKAGHALAIIRERARDIDLNRPAAVDLPQGLRHGDFRVLSDEIPDNSVDLVFTDPPYDKDSVSLYADAARVAARILKPGASMIAYAGRIRTYQRCTQPCLRICATGGLAHVYMMVAAWR